MTGAEIDVIGTRSVALAIADELEDGAPGYLTERALDEAPSQLFRLTP
jgi:hypothetical protein